MLDKYGVELIGAKLDAIKKAEDRLLFKDAMRKIGLEVPESQAGQQRRRTAWPSPAASATRSSCGPASRWAAPAAASPTTARNWIEILERGLDLSPVHEVLIEESALGWKEFELEVMRDLADNAIIICSIENFDPMGVHTGDSITVAPAQTLTDREYQMMRDGALRCLREIGVDTGGSNVQFAIHPENGRMVIIEMNPRVSRSSALASKATGFPIAKIAAKLAVGYRLDEIPNDITRKTPACFEPTIDYVVVKIPRWQFEKFPGADPVLGTQMKSVGEVMAIGRTFKQALAKGMRSLETGKAATRRSLRRSADPAEADHAQPGAARLHLLRLAPRLQRGADPRDDRHRSLVPAADQGDHRPRRRNWRRRALEIGHAASCCARAKRDGFSDACLARTWSADALAVREQPQGAGHPRRVQPRGHLRRRVRELHAVPLLELRVGVRGRARRIARRS